MESEPFEDLLSAGRGKLLELFPEFSPKINSDAGDKLINVFVADVLSEHGLPGSTFHRLDTQRQKELLADKKIDDLFSDLPDGLISFYRDKMVKIE